MAKKTSLQKIYELIEAIKQDDPDATEEAKWSKSGGRRMRVSLSELMKLAKVSRVELLKRMKKS